MSNITRLSPFSKTVHVERKFRSASVMKLSARSSKSSPVSARGWHILCQLDVREEELIPDAYVDLIVSKGFRT
jgi:hypothetical protein